MALKRNIIANIFFVSSFAFFGIATYGLGAVHFTLRGSSSDSNLGLQTQSTQSASASVAMDIGAHFRLGLTHRQDVSAQRGYSQVEKGGQYFFTQTTTRLSANSVDFTVILFYGEIFVPYVMTGLIMKNYLVESIAPAGERTVTPISLPAVPNAGFGVGLRINRNFSLKLSYTVSPGVIQPDPESEPRGILDKVASVGITYNI